MLIVEILLVDLGRYTALTSADALLTLCSADIGRLASLICEASSKTQFHIRQRLIHCAAQVLAASALTLANVQKRKRYIDAEIATNLDQLASILLTILPLMLQHGGYEVYHIH